MTEVKKKVGLKRESQCRRVGNKQVTSSTKTNILILA